MFFFYIKKLYTYIKLDVFTDFCEKIVKISFLKFSEVFIRKLDGLGKKTKNIFLLILTLIILKSEKRSNSANVTYLLKKN